MADPTKIVGTGTRFRPKTPRTTAVLMFYLLATAILDLLVYVTLHRGSSGALTIFGGTAEFMSKFVPAIDGMRDYLEGQGHPGFIAPYRVLTSENWVLFVLFVPAMIAVLAGEIRKKEQEFLSYVDTGWRIYISLPRSALFDPLIRAALSDPLGRSRLFIALFLSGVLALLYTNFLFAISTVYDAPGLFCFIVWSLWAFAFCVGQMLTQFSLVAFYKKRTNVRA
ncbi:MAG TPA: hypothetical protein VGF92_23740 [Stellaceae bacterium]|jgi:hypothetical protein